MLMKGTNGGIFERWWYENLVNMSCSPRAKILCLWIKSGEETQLQKISTKKVFILKNIPVVFICAQSSAGRYNPVSLDKPKLYSIV